MKLPCIAADTYPSSAIASRDKCPDEGGWPQDDLVFSTLRLSVEPAASPSAQWAVLDSNQIIDHFEAVRTILAQMTGVNIVVPRAVIKELEELEFLEESGGTCHVQSALQFLRGRLWALEGLKCSCAADRSSLFLQSKGEAIYEGLLGKSDFQDMSANPDDHVLACVRYFAEVFGPSTTKLLTSNHSLAIKAAFHGVASESVLMHVCRDLAFSAICAEASAEWPPGIGMQDFAVTEFSADRYASESGNGCPRVKVGQGEVDDLGAIAAWPYVSHSQHEIGATSDDSFVDPNKPQGLDVANAEEPEGRGCIISTRSPSSEEGCGDPTDDSAPDGAFEFPPGLELPKAHPEKEFSNCEQSATGEDGRPALKEDGTSGRAPTCAAVGGCAGSVELGSTAKGSMSIVLRGLPFKVTEDEVLDFIYDAGVSPDELAPEAAVSLIANAQGRPSGFAEVRLARDADFWDVRVRLHMQNFRGRYVEALRPQKSRKVSGKCSGGRRAWRKV